MLIALGTTSRIGTPYEHRRENFLDCWVTAVTFAGKVIVRTQAGEELRVDPGVTYFKPGVLYTTHTVPPLHQRESIWIQLQPWATLLPYLDLPESMPGCGYLELREHPHMEAIFEAYRSALRYSRERLPLSDALARNAVERAWLLAADGVRAMRPVRETWLQAVLDHVQQHYAEPLCVADLATVAHLSASRFACLFKRIMNITPMAYVTAIRVEEAKALLLSTNQPIHRIADQLGYENAFHFSRRFSRTVGCSPRAFRQGSLPAGK